MALFRGGLVEHLRKAENMRESRGIELQKGATFGCDPSRVERPQTKIGNS